MQRKTRRCSRQVNLVESDARVVRARNVNIFSVLRGAQLKVSQKEEKRRPSENFPPDPRSNKSADLYYS
jgi:hypothetical protein